MREWFSKLGQVLRRDKVADELWEEMEAPQLTCNLRVWLILLEAQL